MDRGAVAALSAPARHVAMDTSATTATPLLVANGLGIDAGPRPLVRELAFELRAGEFLAVLGRNGSGKSLALDRGVEG